MQIKNEIKGLLESVEPIKTSATGSQYQQILIRVKAPIDGSGMQRGDDELLPVMIFKRELIEKTWIDMKDAAKGTAVKLQVYLNSQERVTENGTFYNLSLSLKSMQPL